MNNKFVSHRYSETILMSRFVRLMTHDVGRRHESDDDLAQLFKMRL